MARLDPLIKVQRHVVDEKRRALAALLREIETLQNKKEHLLMQMAREAALAETAGTPQTLQDYARFAHASRVQMAAIDVAVQKLDLRVAAAQEDIRAAFSDLKKTEITVRERRARDTRAAKQKEDSEFDAIGIDQHARQQTSDE